MNTKLSKDDQNYLRALRGRTLESRQLNQELANRSVRHEIDKQLTHLFLYIESQLGESSCSQQAY